MANKDYTASGDEITPAHRTLTEEAIGRIAQLYAVEKEARGSPPGLRVGLRKAHAAPVFDDLEA